LNDESEKACENFTFLRIDDVNVFGIFVEVSVGADSKHDH